MDDDQNGTTLNENFPTDEINDLSGYNKDSVMYVTRNVSQDETIRAKNKNILAVRIGDGVVDASGIYHVALVTVQCWLI